MADRAFIRQEIIDAGTLNVSDIKCPGCGNKTLVLNGQAQIPKREIIEEGAVIDVVLGAYEEGCFDVEKIGCLHCNTEFIIKDHELFRLEKENLELKVKLYAQQGKPIPGSGYIN